MVGIISQVENGCEAMADRILVLIPHNTMHDTVSILVQKPKLAANVGRNGAIKNKHLDLPMSEYYTKHSRADAEGWLA